MDSQGAKKSPVFRQRNLPAENGRHCRCSPLRSYEHPGERRMTSSRRQVPHISSVHVYALPADHLTPLLLTLSFGLGGDLRSWIGRRVGTREKS